MGEVDHERCPGYVWSKMERRITCTCALPPHPGDQPHECVSRASCGGSWFGSNGEVDQVVRLPRLSALFCAEWLER